MPANDVASTISNAIGQTVPFILLSEICIGTIYDVLGRKKPLAFSYAMVSIGFLFLISGQTTKIYYIAKFFGVFE